MDERKVKLIAAACEEWGYRIEGWDEDEEGARAQLGRAQPLEDDEENGIFPGDEGDLVASVVGAEEYGNERVWFGLKVDGRDEAVEIRPDNIDGVS